MKKRAKHARPKGKMPKNKGRSRNNTLEQKWKPRK